MSYRRKRLWVLAVVTVLSANVLYGCAAGTGTQTKTEVTEEAETTETGQDGTDSVTYSFEDMFTDRDLAGTYDTESAVFVTLSDDASTVEDTKADGVLIEENVVTITEEGTYIISGTLTDGQIVVDAADAKVQVVLDGVDISCVESAVIYVKDAKKVFLTLADSSENELSHSGTYTDTEENNVDAVVFAKSDLTLNGTGSLRINAETGHGIVSKDGLKVTGGTYEVTAEGQALSGKDSVRIADGVFTLVSGKDGIHSENEEDGEKGYIYIADGTFTVTSDGDGMEASSDIWIEDGTFEVTAGGGAANSTKQHNDMPQGGGHMPGGEMSQNGEKPEGEPPQMRENSDSDGELPQNGEKPEGEPPQMGEKPEGESPQQKEQSSDGTGENGADTDTTESVTSTKGIKASGNIFLKGGSYTFDTADDSIHSNSSITIDGGVYTISTGDDGVHAEEALVANDGTITITESYEGLEGTSVTINGGTIDINASNDGVNAAGANDEVWMEINGGWIHILSGGDGLDSNGDMTINGGEIYIDGPSDNGNSAIDYGDRASAYINGGTVVAVGSSGMAEEMSSESTQPVILVKLGSQMEAGEVNLTDSDGKVLISYTTSKSYDCVILSTAGLEKGETYTLTTSGTTTEVSP